MLASVGNSGVAQLSTYRSICDQAIAYHRFPSLIELAVVAYGWDIRETRHRLSSIIPGNTAFLLSRTHHRHGYSVALLPYGLSIGYRDTAGKLVSTLTPRP